MHDALKLLRDDNLVWSEEFDAIRKPLADLLERISQSPSHQFDAQVDAILQALTTDQHISDPMEAWLIDAARQLGYLEDISSRSDNFKNAIKRLFRAL